MHDAIAAAVVVIGALAVTPAVGYGATSAEAQAQSAVKQSKAATVARHATTGVVKSVNATTLVIVRSGSKRKGRQMTFVLDPATHREGTVEVGGSVSVRYREDGKTHVATAITAQQPKQQAVHAAPSGR